MLYLYKETSDTCKKQTTHRLFFRGRTPQKLVDPRYTLAWEAVLESWSHDVSMWTSHFKRYIHATLLACSLQKGAARTDQNKRTITATFNFYKISKGVNSDMRNVQKLGKADTGKGFLYHLLKGTQTRTDFTATAASRVAPLSHLIITFSNATHLHFKACHAL
jgi:hypothetical protein